MSTTSFSWLKGAIPFVAIAAIALSACGNKKSNAETTAESTEETSVADHQETALLADSIYWADSISTPKGYKAYCRIDVDYPVEGTPQLLDSLRQWIALQLATNNFITSDTIKPLQIPGTDLADGKKYVAAVGAHVLDQAKADLTELEQFNGPSDISYEFSWNIGEVYHTAKFVTFASSTYCYLGGAHGGSGFNPQVFGSETGQLFGWNMILPDSVPALKEVIKQGLMTQYFEVKTVDEFRDGLLINPDTLPLPATPPYFSKEGVNFIYQQYEIAPYAAGMPGCVLPYATVRPMLTPVAAALLPSE